MFLRGRKRPGGSATTGERVLTATIVLSKLSALERGYTSYKCGSIRLTPVTVCRVCNVALYHPRAHIQVYTANAFRNCCYAIDQHFSMCCAADWYPANAGHQHKALQPYSTAA